MKFLAYDGPLAQAIRNILNLVILNICFWVCSIPVVTMGASITALYSVFLNREDDSNIVFRYFRAWKSNFKKATAIWMIIMLIGIMVLINIWMLFSFALPGEIFIWIILILLTILFFSIATFALALQARYENTVRQTLRNAVVLGTVGIVNGALATVISFLPVIVFFFAVELLVIFLAVWIPLGVSASVTVNARVVNCVFRRVETIVGASDASSFQKEDE